MEQLQFELDELLDRAASGRRHPNHEARDATGRLLWALVKRGLDESALPAAARLVIELDDEANDSKHHHQEGV